MSFVTEIALLSSYLGRAGKIGQPTGICDTKLLSKNQEQAACEELEGN